MPPMESPPFRLGSAYFSLDQSISARQSTLTTGLLICLYKGDWLRAQQQSRNRHIIRDFKILKHLMDERSYGSTVSMAFIVFSCANIIAPQGIIPFLPAPAMNLDSDSDSPACTAMPFRVGHALPGRLCSTTCSIEDRWVVSSIGAGHQEFWRQGGARMGDS